MFYSPLWNILFVLMLAILCIMMYKFPSPRHDKSAESSDIRGRKEEKPSNERERRGSEKMNMETNPMLKELREEQKQFQHKLEEHFQTRLHNEVINTIHRVEAHVKRTSRDVDELRSLLRSVSAQHSTASSSKPREPVNVHIHTHSDATSTTTSSPNMIRSAPERTERTERPVVSKSIPVPVGPPHVGPPHVGPPTIQSIPSPPSLPDLPIVEANRVDNTQSQPENKSHQRKNSVLNKVPSSLLNTLSSIYSKR